MASLWPCTVSPFACRRFLQIHRNNLLEQESTIALHMVEDMEMFSDPLGKIRKAAATCKIPEKLPRLQWIWTQRSQPTPRSLL